jgi:AcrR family transcriptional regulator
MTNGTIEPQDRRIKRTQQSLAKALISLTLEKDYDTITIRDITERADIGYATFFRHYSDKDALLQDVLEVVFAEMIARLPPAPDADPAEVGTTLFRYVQEQSEICRVLLSSRGATAMLRRVIEAGTETLLAQHRPKELSTVPPEIAAYHFVTGSVSLVQWWLEHGQPFSPGEMGNIYRDLLYLPTMTLAFEAPQP